MTQEKMITVRVSRQMREAVKQVAYERRRSVNDVATDLLMSAILRSPAAVAVLRGKRQKG